MHAKSARLCKEAANGVESPARRIADLCRERRIRLIDIWFTELGGRPWRLTLNAENLDDKMFRNGVLVDGKQVGGSWDGLIALVPDPAHSFVDPIATVPTLALFCDVRQASGEPYAQDPRSALKRTLRYFRRAWPGWTWNLGAELESFLIGADGNTISNASLRELVRECWDLLSAAGIAVDWFRIGPPDGLGRIQMKAADALKTADQAVLYKHVLRRAARRHGLTARFIAKPFSGPGSASMLTHHALWKDGENRFFDAGGWAQTSSLARTFAAGLLRHAPALLAFCAPSTNSYRRLAPGEGPVHLILSQTHSAAACRVPAGTTGSSPASRRVKFCCADPSANPYLAFAVLLLAGLDGVERAVEARPDVAVASSPMPRSLDEALDALKLDFDFLLKGGAFTSELIEAWIEDRRRTQILPVRAVPHPKELELDRED